MMATNRILAEAHWTASDAHAKFADKYPNISPRHFLAHSRTLTRSKATLLFRLTAGHVQLKQHLYRLQLVDSPKCDHCGNDSETTTHFLFRCPHYARQRREHLASRGPDYLRLAFLLHAPSALEPLFDYVKATGRFADLVR
ncbi:reverse transcriptase from transposon X-element protein, putative, partial [Rhizoctonia solani AG-3 Rhs1AP]